MKARFTEAAGFVVLVIVTAGCAGSSASWPADAAAPAPASTPSDCLLGANGADVEVGIANLSQSCNQWVQGLAGTGLAWNPITTMGVPGSQAADGDILQEACDLTANGGEELYVEDTGGMTYGNSICSDEEQNGWAPESTPGPLASAAQRNEQHQAAVSASAAAASASAARASQASADDAQIIADLAQARKDYNTWTADVSTAQSALQVLKAEPLCSGGTPDQQTYDDAQNVYDDGQSIYDDESALTTESNILQRDIGTLSGDPQYAADMSAAQTALSKAQGAVNADESSKIQQAATAVQTAIDSCT